MASDSITGAAPGVDRVRTTRYFSFMVLWVVISAFNYGFGISELNPLQGALTCRDKEGGQAGASARDELSTQGIPDCVPMTDAEFGLVTATFTLGGLLASAGSPLLGRWGRKGNVLVCAALNAAGEAVVALAASRTALGFGRFVVGLGAGVGVCVVPIFLK